MCYKIGNRKRATFLLFTLLIFTGCNNSNEKQTDILQPDFNITVDKLMQNGFYPIPEDVFIIGKQIGDTLLYYQFDDNANIKSKPRYMFCEFPISSINIDSVDIFLEDRMYFRMCEYKNTDLLHIFYIKHQFKGYFFECTINKINKTLGLCYTYPQID